MKGLAFHRGRVWFTLELDSLFIMKDDLFWPLMTSEVILYLIKNVRLYNVSIQINLYKIRFINECARKIKAKIPESHIFRVLQSQSFLVRCRRTYVIKKVYVVIESINWYTVSLNVTFLCSMIMNMNNFFLLKINHILLAIDWKVVFFISKNICFYELPL